MMGELTGKAVVITGAGQGLGMAYSLAVTREGADLVINDSDRSSISTIRI